MAGEQLTTTEIFSQQWGLEPSGGQARFFRFFDAFISSAKERCVLILRGYAGTGKTTMLSVALRYCRLIEREVIVLAPTGRAAKVISAYSGLPAYTIHKFIYEQSGDRFGGFKLKLKPNLFKNTLFIVDEASMIQAEEEQSGYSVHGSLLMDLFSFVFSVPGSRLILAGDTAQLPPVGSEHSWALNKNWLERHFELNLGEVELTEVLRQSINSGILSNATMLRFCIDQKQLNYTFKLPAPDLEVLSSYDLQDALEQSFAEYGRDGVMLITRSNKRANDYSRQIRSRILYFDSELTEDDHLMVVKNNYYWIGENRLEGSFIANGEVARVLRLRGEQEAFGMRFADARIQLLDSEIELEVKLCLDVLSSETAALSVEKSQQIFEELKLFYSAEGSKRKIMQKIKEDPFYQALQVKYAYAVTCHKAQGGQWPVVFIDQGYLTEDQVNVEYYRWLYTAITRSTEKVYLLNFDSRFFNADFIE